MIDTCVQLSRSVALRLSLPCSLREVRPAALRLSAFLKDQGLRPEELHACELAMVEACNNAVQYASGKGRQQRIGVDVLCDPNGVELRIRDNTPGFEWPAVIELPGPELERGRGLFLIRSLMDEAHYYRGGETNCLVLQKARTANPQAPEPPLRSTLQQLSHQLRESEQIISDMAEELSSCYESLSAIFRCSAEQGRMHNLKDFSQRLLSDLAQITSADWFILRLLSRDDTQLTVFTASDQELMLPPLGVAPSPPRPSLELRAALARQDVWFDSEALAEFQDPLATVKAGSSGLIHPFALGEQLIGTLAIGNASGRPQFTAVHANVVHTFADFLGIQITNARFQEDQVHARLVSRELEIAKNIQRSLLPKKLPDLPGYAVAGFCESAQQVGGDFYDVLKFNETSLLLIIADVMGKGIPAAMFAAILRSLLRAMPEWTSQPAQLLSRVNRLLFKDLSGVDMFITAQVVLVDTSERRLVAASAGHCPVLLADAHQRSLKSLSPEGLPLGIQRDVTFGAQVEGLPTDSRILLYTDGLTEARNGQGEFFGPDRLTGWFERSLQHSRSAEQLKEELAGELGQFQSSAPLQDDQTFLIVA